MSKTKNKICERCNKNEANVNLMLGDEKEFKITC
jgi:hypothetical protein